MDIVVRFLELLIWCFPLEGSHNFSAEKNLIFWLRLIFALVNEKSLLLKRFSSALSFTTTYCAIVVAESTTTNFRLRIVKVGGASYLPLSHWGKKCERSFKIVISHNQLLWNLPNKCFRSNIHKVKYVCSNFAFYHSENVGILYIAPLALKKLIWSLLYDP